MAEKRPSKGLFGAELPVAGRYLIPGRRARLLWLGLAGCAAALLGLGLARIASGRNPTAPGPLSSHHATIEKDCASCHASPLRPVTDSCRTCHEKVGDTRGTYSFASHYRGKRHPEKREEPCSTCHPEHGGREAAITAVPDSQCLRCHDIGSFNRRHPEFQFAREHQPDDAHLRFSHWNHVRAVRERENLADPQLACLRCHQPDARGEHFAPLDFERQCGACHLTAATGTPRLPVGNPAGNSPGVETLQALVARQGPAVRWAYFTDPGEFRESGGTVAKRPVYHADPWVMENLKNLRRALYPGASGLAELLSTSIDHGAAGARPATLTREALATLRAQAETLRGRPEPEIQEELRALEPLFAEVDRRLARGESVPADLFRVAAKPGVPAERAARIRQLALDLTEPCRTCHVVSDAAILRVQTDQRTLSRAEFSHRAHLLVRPICTDCHSAIPGLGAEQAPRDESRDVAETQNLPAIATCRQCHEPRQVASICVTCHRFHPDSQDRDLTVYRTAGAP